MYQGLIEKEKLYFNRAVYLLMNNFFGSHMPFKKFWYYPFLLICFCLMSDLCVLNG